MRLHPLSWTAVWVATAWAGSAMAQADATVQEPRVQNVAQLSASGTVDVQQDLLSMSLTTAASGSDANAVQAQLKQALDAALAQARPGAAVGQMEVRTGNFSLFPRYGKDSQMSGWQGSAELVLEGRDFARITSTAGKIKSLTLGNVGFSLSREQRARVEAEAQALAIDSFKAKALSVAKGFGFTGYTLRDVSVNSNEQGYGPRPRLAAMQARGDVAEAVPVEAGKTAVQVTVSGSVQMR